MATDFLQHYFKLDDPQYEAHTVFSPDTNLMERALTANNTRMDGMYSGLATLQSQLKFDHLNLENENRRAQAIIDRYNKRVDDIVGKISEDPANVGMYMPMINAMHHDIIKDTVSGDIYHMARRFNEQNANLKANQSISDAGTKELHDMYNRAVLTRMDRTEEPDWTVPIMQLHSPDEYRLSADDINRTAATLGNATFDSSSYRQSDGSTLAIKYVSPERALLIALANAKRDEYEKYVRDTEQALQEVMRNGQTNEDRQKARDMYVNFARDTYQFDKNGNLLLGKDGKPLMKELLRIVRNKRGEIVDVQVNSDNKFAESNIQGPYRMYRFQQNDMTNAPSNGGGGGGRRGGSGNEPDDALDKDIVIWRAMNLQPFYNGEDSDYRDKLFEAKEIEKRIADGKMVNEEDYEKYQSYQGVTEQGLPVFLEKNPTMTLGETFGIPKDLTREQAEKILSKNVNTSLMPSFLRLAVDGRINERLMNNDKSRDIIANWRNEVYDIITNRAANGIPENQPIYIVVDSILENHRDEKTIPFTEGESLTLTDFDQAGFLRNIKFTDSKEKKEGLPYKKVISINPQDALTLLNPNVEALTDSLMPIIGSNYSLKDIYNSKKPGKRFSIDDPFSMGSIHGEMLKRDGVAGDPSLDIVKATALEVIGKSLYNKVQDEDGKPIYSGKNLPVNAYAGNQLNQTNRANGEESAEEAFVDNTYWNNPLQKGVIALGNDIMKTSTVEIPHYKINMDKVDDDTLGTLTTTLLSHQIASVRKYQGDGFTTFDPSDKRYEEVMNILSNKDTLKKDTQMEVFTVTPYAGKTATQYLGIGFSVPDPEDPANRMYVRFVVDVDEKDPAYRSLKTAIEGLKTSTGRKVALLLDNVEERTLDKVTRESSHLNWLTRTDGGKSSFSFTGHGFSPSDTKQFLIRRDFFPGDTNRNELFICDRNQAQKYFNENMRSRMNVKGDVGQKEIQLELLSNEVLDKLMKELELVYGNNMVYRASSIRMANQYMRGKLPQ